jgi:hypothetical protein
MRLILSSVSVESVSEFDADCTTQIQQVVLLKPSLTPDDHSKAADGPGVPEPSAGISGKGSSGLANRKA